MNAAPRLPILYEDADLVVVNKPAGLASVPSPGVSGKTCLSELQASHPDARAVHRLDRETSGVMCFARSAAAAAALVEEFRARRVEKTYWAWVRGTPSPRAGEIRRPIEDLGDRARISAKGQTAVTRYRVLDRYLDVSRVEAVPVTGRYNQVRIHLAALGHPLLGERKYARGKDSPRRFRRVALHARSLAFHHPRTGKEIAVTAPLPEDLERLAASLGEPLRA